VADKTALTRDAVRDLILVLADSKRLLGMRYAAWILGAPELEAGIACASMAQDEWGHGRLLYALLKEFDEDVGRIEHEREPGEYASMDVLDEEPPAWPDLVALNVLADGALSTQFEALRQSSHVPLRQRVAKLLDEERFHAAHGAAWFRRLARGGDTSRGALTTAVRRILPDVIRWFGPDSERSRLLRAEDVVDASGFALRDRFFEGVAPLLGEIGVDANVDTAYDGFDEARRRANPAGPDAAVIARVRGDKNRVFLLD